MEQAGGFAHTPSTPKGGRQEFELWLKNRKAGQCCPSPITGQRDQALALAEERSGQRERRGAGSGVTAPNLPRKAENWRNTYRICNGFSASDSHSGS